MKRKNLILIIISIITLFAVMISSVACNNAETEQETPKKYIITVAQNSDCTLTPNVTSASFADTITVTVKVNNPDKYVSGVKYNNKECFKDGNNYTFTMPSENVTLSAELSDYEEKLSDGNSYGGSFVSFASTNSKTIVKKESGTAQLTLYFNANYMTILKSEIISSNEDAIPVSAINVQEKTSSLGNAITSATVSIDQSKINLGTTWLTMNFTNGNSSSQKGTIIVKITVAETLVLEKWTETVIFNVSRIDENAEYYIYFRDTNYNADSGEKEYQYFDNVTAVDGKVTLEIEYVANHQYWVEFGVKSSDGSKITYHDLLETIGTGSSSTGYNKYQSDKLSFIEDNASLEITVLRTTHS